ncbi:MAG: 4-hydroxy-tetrahydrodipicolinate reductase [Flavobacteriales bacterium]|nr:4-hydroxy-tetrahydrodipicolinate reductase [Flavobacteriales bacterium]
MRITLIGHGKTGKKIEEIGIQRGHEFPIIITSSNSNSITTEELSKCDVAIDFSSPEIALENIDKCFEANLPIVVGTTGWHDKYEDVRNKCLDKNQTLFFASNFSIGANIMFNINEKLATLMNQQNGYNVEMSEVHHIHKKDHPSGTAITIANGVLDNFNSKSKWTLEENGNPNELMIHSRREGDVKGIHGVKYISDVDTLELIHNVSDRAAFALGSVIAAEWVSEKKGVFGMKDLLNQ